MSADALQNILHDIRAAAEKVAKTPPPTRTLDYKTIVHADGTLEDVVDADLLAEAQQAPELFRPPGVIHLVYHDRPTPAPLKIG